MREPIAVHDHDPAWAASYAEQRDRLTPVLAPWITAPLEHIGSTAVPGLAAKPIIDMLALVEHADAFAPALLPLADVGWVHAPEPRDQERHRWSLCYPDPAHRTHHLHVVEQRSADWPDWLLFRDHLRAHPEAAQRYAALKRRLAEADPDDRPRYRTGKGPLIAELLAQAWGP